MAELRITIISQVNPCSDRGNSCGNIDASIRDVHPLSRDPFSRDHQEGVPLLPAVLPQKFLLDK